MQDSIVVDENQQQEQLIIIQSELIENELIESQNPQTLNDDEIDILEFLNQTQNNNQSNFIEIELENIILKKVAECYNIYQYQKQTQNLNKQQQDLQEFINSRKELGASNFQKRFANIFFKLPLLCQFTLAYLYNFILIYFLITILFIKKLIQIKRGEIYSGYFSKSKCRKRFCQIINVIIEFFYCLIFQTSSYYILINGYYDYDSRYFIVFLFHLIAFGYITLVLTIEYLLLLYIKYQEKEDFSRNVENNQSQLSDLYFEFMEHYKYSQVFNCLSLRNNFNRNYFLNQQQKQSKFFQQKLQCNTEEIGRKQFISALHLNDYYQINISFKSVIVYALLNLIYLFSFGFYLMYIFVDILYDGIDSIYISMLLYYTVMFFLIQTMLINSKILQFNVGDFQITKHFPFLLSFCSSSKHKIPTINYFCLNSCKSWISMKNISFNLLKIRLNYLSAFLLIDYIQASIIFCIVVLYYQGKIKRIFSQDLNEAFIFIFIFSGIKTILLSFMPVIYLFSEINNNQREERNDILEIIKELEYLKLNYKQIMNRYMIFMERTKNEIKEECQKNLNSDKLLQFIDLDYFNSFETFLIDYQECKRFRGYYEVKRNCKFYGELFDSDIEENQKEIKYIDQLIKEWQLIRKTLKQNSDSYQLKFFNCIPINYSKIASFISIIIPTLITTIYTKIF